MLLLFVGFGVRGVVLFTLLLLRCLLLSMCCLLLVFATVALLVFAGCVLGL